MHANTLGVVKIVVWASVLKLVQVMGYAILQLQNVIVIQTGRDPTVVGGHAHPLVTVENTAHVIIQQASVGAGQRIMDQHVA